jgi:hypothetical protein
LSYATDRMALVLLRVSASGSAMADGIQPPRLEPAGGTREGYGRLARVWGTRA